MPNGAACNQSLTKRQGTYTAEDILEPILPILYDVVRLEEFSLKNNNQNDVLTPLTTKEIETRLLTAKAFYSKYLNYNSIYYG